MRRVALSILLLAALPIAAQADSCRRLAGESRPRPRSDDCRSEDRVVPYDPTAPKAGRDRGFVDLGNGTEVKVGGRVRLDYDARR